MLPEAALALALAVFFGLRYFWRGRTQPMQPPPDHWREILRAHLPHMRLLDVTLRPRFEAQVEQFLREKQFIGCNGFVINDKVRTLIAGLACLLVLRPQAKAFPALRSVLVYPGAFLVPQNEPDELGLVDDEPAEQIGESWSDERVILSWADVEATLRGDEINVVAHEFAHQLDDETPAIEGAPALQDYSHWAEVMQREFERLRRHRRPPVLDPYGAENPAEFFAVVTEAYFQRGAALRQHHADLYELLKNYYLLDTAQLPLPSQL